MVVATHAEANMILQLKPKSFPSNDYPTSDGKPMAETDDHRKLMIELIQTLDEFFAAVPDVYVTGNLLLFYEKGNKRRHVSPDVFVVRGVEKAQRPNYLMWKEKTPDVVIEITSKTTRREDANKKWDLYERVLKVKEYYLFDLKEEYLKPSFQGYRRSRGKFIPIECVAGRMPSELLGLHLERVGEKLRLWNPATGERVQTPAEQLALETQRAYQAAERADFEEERAQMEKERADRAEAELQRLRLQLAAALGHRNGQ
jgi:Uma2 family endonuclease